MCLILEQLQRKNRRSGIFGGLKLSEVQRHLQLLFLQEEARTPTHWYACAHSQDNWFFLYSEILHAKGPENFGIKKIVKGVDVGPTHTRRQHD
ncbi:unnamed protein product [Camellia sinensis]